MKTLAKKGCSFFIILCCALSLIWLVPSGEAEAGDARGNIYPGDDVSALAIYARHKTGNRFYRDGKLVTKDGDYELNYTIVRPIYYKDVWGIPATIQALLPFGDATMRTSREGLSQSTSDLMDPTLILGFWPIANKETKTWLLIAEYISMPLGDYDNSRLSLGTNRWGFKTVAGFVKGWGKFYFDLEPSIEFYTDNDEFLASGTITEVDQDMDPMVRVESHISYDFTPQFRLALDYYYENGGEKSYRHPVTKLKDKRDEKDNHAVQVSAFFQLAPKHQILVQYLRELEVENGFKTNMLGFRYFYVF
ncbi:transporter [Desulfococcaceae bacterium OttesenSCG-928-F15]|nr:transporter [Desulfococcaceae bacterium OttesenSCG-928-F15]